MGITFQSGLDDEDRIGEGLAFIPYLALSYPNPSYSIPPDALSTEAT
jgi:hypothetical protein